MKIVTLITALFLALHSFGQNGSKNFIDQNYIEVTGKAEMEIVPDEIYLTIYINEDSLKGSKTVDEAEMKMINILTGEGIDVSKNLKIRDIVSNLNSYWLKSDKVTTTKEYQLMLCDAKTTVTVFKKLKPLGITSISISRVSHSKLKEFKEEVKIKAIKIAKHKAKMLTNAIDQVCGKAIYINEINTNQQNFAPANANILMEREYSASKLKFESAPILQFEKIKLQSTMYVKFKIS